MPLLNKDLNKQGCVLYVDRDSLTYYTKANQKPHVLELSNDVVKDMEIESPEKLIQTLASWMDTSKILAGDMVVVLSPNVYFEHAVQSLANSDADEKEMETFLGTVPFTRCVSRIITEGASKRTVVISKDYFDLLLEFLEKRYFRIVGLFPLSLLKVKSPEEIKIDHMIKNIDDYKKVNLATDFERKVVQQSFLSKSKPKDTKNLKMMVFAFGFLLVVLGVMIYFTFIRK